MFNRLTSAIFEAVDYLAPSVPPQEEFEYNWSQITQFYTDKSSSSTAPIEVTKIPHHLRCMLQLLQRETDVTEDSYGPCLEYFLHHKILSSMCTLAMADTPPGMKKHIIIFAKELVQNSNQPLLTHVSIYNSVLKLIKLCGEHVASPSEKSEIEFLEVICQNLKNTPHLIASFFITDPLNSALQNLHITSDATSPAVKEVSDFPLINAFLVLLQSPDCDVMVKAGVNIVSCVSFISNESAALIVSHTKLCETIIKKLSTLYLEIRKNVSPIDMCDVEVTWQYVLPSDIQISQPLRKVICFMMWFDLFNQLCANAAIKEHLFSMFSEELLEKLLYADLIKSHDSNTQLFTTSLFISCLRHSSCTLMQDLIINFLLDDSVISKITDKALSIRKILIKRCRQVNSNLELAIETLHLFDQILRKPTESILNFLVINNIKTRSYFDSSINYDIFEGSDDEEATQIKGDNEVEKKKSLLLNKTINCFLYLVPEEIKSCDSQESSYETYIHDVQKCYQSCYQMCQTWDWPKEPAELSDDNASSDSQPEADGHFHEGEFLSILLTNLEHMVDFPYDLTLLVTSLISRLALFPHPNLNEFLLNPLLPLRGETRSLFSILLSVVEDLNDRALDIPQLKDKLATVRVSLLTDEIETDLHPHDFQVLQSIIVVEEFCKELAAIAFVKHNFVF